MKSKFFALNAGGVLFFGAFLSTLVAGNAKAQSAPNLLTSPISHIMPPTVPNFGKKSGAVNKNNEVSHLPAVSIKIRSVAVLGGSVFPQSKLESIVSGLSGQNVMLSKLAADRLALVELYRRHGYIFTTVMLNIDSAGNAQFIITEGYISSVKLSKNIGPAGTLVMKMLQHLVNSGPLNEASLEHWVLLANRMPGVSVQAILQADPGNPGGMVLVADVSKQTFSGLITADNRASPESGTAEGLLVADINSLTSHGDQTEVSFYHTEGGTYNFGQISESFYLGASGLKLDLYGGAGRSSPYGVLGWVGYKSWVQVFGGRLSYPVILRRDRSLDVHLGVDAEQSRIMTANTLKNTSSVRVARLGGQYAWQDIWLGDTRNAVNVVDLELSQGLPFLGSSSDGRTAPPGERDDAKFDFWKVNASINRDQVLFPLGAKANVALYTAVGGQYSTDILPSAEEFYLGGARYTRGYYSGQVVGDKAVYTTAELQLNTGTDFSVFQHKFNLGAQFYGFYDWGEEWSNMPMDLNHRIASVGGGVKLGLTQNFELDGEVTHRLVTQLDPGSTNVAPLSDTAIYWGITGHY